MAFTAGFFFWSTLFLHFYEISRPRSFTFLLFVLVLLIRPYLLSPYYYPIPFDATGRPLSGEIGGKQDGEDKCYCEGAEDTNQLSRSARLGLYSGQNWIATCVWGRGCCLNRSVGAEARFARERMTGRSMLILVLTRPSLLLLEPWPTLEKALVVEEGMNRESDEREILQPAHVSAQNM